MRKMCFLILVLLCLGVTPKSIANTETLNWCGTYFEKNDRGYIRMPRKDFPLGSNTCNLTDYNERLLSSGSAVIALDFSNRHSTIGHWRKFSNHLIELKGKFRNGALTNLRFIRDMGV